MIGIILSITRLYLLDYKSTGGEGGIRTPDTVSGMPVFKTGAINRSATSPANTVLLQRQCAWRAIERGRNCKTALSAKQERFQGRTP